jgi:hypothetical protein
MTAEDITNQFKRSQREIERRKQFITRMERKLVAKQRKSAHRHVPSSWFPIGFSLGTDRDDTELPADIFKDL